VILLLAVDPTNEAPMLDFSIRQSMNRAMLQVADQLKIPHWDDGAVREAAQGVRGILDILTITPVKLEEIAREVVRASPIDLLQRVTRIGESLQRVVRAGNEVHDRIAEALLRAKQPLVVVSAAAGAAMVRAAANLVWALHRTSGTNCWLSIVVPDCNSMGVTLLGGRPVSDVLDEFESGAADSLVVLENDLFRLVDPDRADRALSRLKNLIVLDCIESQTGALAHLRLPASAYAESNGTYVNNEVRAQRFFQVFVPEGEQTESWAMLGTVARSLRPSAAAWKIYEDVTREISQQIPDLAGAINAAPAADWRVAQMKIAREHQRYSGRTAMSAQISVRDVPPPTDPETPFAFTMEGYQGRPPSALIPRFWAPGWNSVQSVTRFQEEVNGPLRGGNPGVRMIEPAEASPRPFEAEEVRPLADGEFWLAPVWRIFGSEQLSNLSPSIQELIPKAMLGLNPEDAKALGVGDGELIEFDLGQQSRELPAKLDPALPRRVATVPVGYPEGRGIFSPGPVVLAPMALRKVE
jgi:NADH-quinone oxidoreductase subunit G